MRGTHSTVLLLAFLIWRVSGFLIGSSVTTSGRLAIVVEAPVRLHHHGPGARAVAEGEARSPLILVDAPLNHAIDEPPTHLGLERLGRQAEPGRQEIRVDHDLPLLDADKGGWALHARTPFTSASFKEWTRSAGMSGPKR